MDFPCARFADNPRHVLLRHAAAGHNDNVRAALAHEFFQQRYALGTTVLVVTHERELVNRFTKRVVAISEGRIISDGMDGYYLNEEE